MLILAFDTTNELGGAGLYEDARCLGEITAPARQDSAARMSYSVTLFEMVERLLKSNRAQLKDVELFAVTEGPGSLTGIRVGIAAAQGWAQAFGRPVLGVSVLEAMIESGQPETSLAAALLDARRGEFFLGSFERDDAPGGLLFKPRGEGMVLRPENLREHLTEFPETTGGITLVAREHDRAAQALRPLLPEKFEWRIVKGTLVPAIARLALEAARRGELQSPAELDACYIRRSDAEMHWHG